MGQEARCTVEFGERRSEGKALLETAELVFRGEFRLRIPLAAIRSVTARDGRLTVAFTDGVATVATFELGPLAEKWAQRIRHRPTLMDKLGVRPGARVLVLGVADAGFLAALKERTADAAGSPRPDNDLVFFAAQAREDLGQLAEVRRCLRPNGALWVIRPRGRPEITERDVMDAGKEVGLVDVKVARFSETHTAEKFVIPVARR